MFTPQIKKYLSTYALAVIVAVAALFSYWRDDLARISWYRFKSARAALLLDRGDAALAMFIGNYYFGGIHYDLEVAGKAFAKALSINDNILLGHYQLARVFYANSKFQEALSEINKEIQTHPSNGRAFYVRGLIYAYMGKFDESEKDFRRFVAWAPKEWAGYNDLAWILMKEKRYGEAEKVSEDGIQKASGGSTNPWLWNHLGLARLNQKKYKAAENAFEKAKKLAKSLTLDEWRRAYPGNDPASAARGRKTFINAVDYNRSQSMLQ